jgi:hypothetical protein
MQILAQVSEAQVVQGLPGMCESLRSSLSTIKSKLHRENPDALPSRLIPPVSLALFLLV